MWRVINSVLEALEKGIVRFNKWSYIPNSKEKMLYLNPYLYKGKPVTLNDGTKIEEGDPIGEIHIDNIKVKAVSTDYSNMMKILFNEIHALKNAILDETIGS